MTDEEKDLLIAYLVDAGEIFPDLDVDVEDQFLNWYEVRQGVVSGETHYKAILQAARVRNRSLERGLEGAQPPMSDRQGVCDHGTPCGCYAEGHAAGLGPTPHRPTGRHGEGPQSPGPRQRVGG